MPVAELPEPRRRWKAWAILEPDETLYQITREDPATSDAIKRLVEMGWMAVPVDVVERH